MNEIMIFSNPEFGNVRTVTIDGRIYFSGTDVAKALGYSKPQDAVSRHCRHSLKHGGVSETTNQYGTTTKQNVDKIPTLTFEIVALPDIEMESLVRFDYTPQFVEDAVAVLRHELLAHGEIYNGFKASLKSALEKYNCCGLPFEPEEEIAGKMLDFLIGEEK